jgi:hypothetical protein
MKNNIVCGSCGTENAFYEVTCKNCKAYLRDKVFNIDLWKISARLIESPTKAFQQIIFSEHKNFIFFLIFFVSIKFLIDARLTKIFILNQEGSWNNFIVSFLIVLAGIILFLILYSILITFFNKVFELTTRFKDNFSILTYSLIPYLFALVILFPIEIVIFGGALFSNNPSPFILKETLAYILTGFEIFCIVWTIVLSVFAMLTQSKNIIYGIVTGLLFNILLCSLIYFFSKVLFQ